MGGIDSSGCHAIAFVTYGSFHFGFVYSNYIPVPNHTHSTEQQQKITWLPLITLTKKEHMFEIVSSFKNTVPVDRVHAGRLVIHVRIRT